MLIKTIKVSEKGQIAIPREIREKLKINQGDELVVIQNGGRILIEKSLNLSKKMNEDFKDLLYYTEHSLKEVWDNPADDIWNQYLKK